MSRFPDMLEHLGGVPVGSSSKYAGWWNNETYFVDYDYGPGGDGRSMATAKKYLADAISSAGAWDTIYIRPRDPSTTGGDSNYHAPESATNWTIPAAEHGMSLIGTGLGRDGHGMAYQTYLRGHASVTTGSVLEIRAPYCVIENLAFHRGGGTSTGIVAFSASPGVYSGFAGSVNNCLFRFGNGTSVANPALLVYDSWYVQIYDNTFYRNAVGIGMYCVNSSTRAVDIRGNTFEGLPADVRAHIAANGTASYITIANNLFIDDTPTAGYAKYIDMSADGGSASTGGVLNNYFGTATLVTATLMTLNGLLEGGSQCSLGFLTS